MQDDPESLPVVQLAVMEHPDEQGAPAPPAALPALFGVQHKQSMIPCTSEAI
jgi:hypothetical protein